MESKLTHECFLNVDRYERAITNYLEKHDHTDKAKANAMMDPLTRVLLYKKCKDNTLLFLPMHDAAIPRDDKPNDPRIVHISEAEARIFQNVVYSAMTDTLKNFIHPNSKAYQPGLSCGSVVKELKIKLLETSKNKRGKQNIAIKIDFHHFFDDVSRKALFALLDRIEDYLGCERNTEIILNWIRREFSCDYKFTEDNELVEEWCGIRQGNSIAAFLANAILYELDEFMSNKYSYWVRYCDDAVVITDNIDEAIADINKFINAIGVTLNPNKVEVINTVDFFKFLGFSISADGTISLSKERMKRFYKEVVDCTINGKDESWVVVATKDDRTIKRRKFLRKEDAYEYMKKQRLYRKKLKFTVEKSVKPYSYEKALNHFNKYFYKGDGEHSPASQILSVMNSENDITIMNSHVMNCLRAVQTGNKNNIPGIGYMKMGFVSKEHGRGVMQIGKGKHIRSNIEKVESLDGYKTIECMRQALITNKLAYKSIVLAM